MTSAEVIVIGAGVVGSAIAYGITGAGRRVMVLDGADTDFRASRANFGLVWVQGKGPGMPEYQHLTRESADSWASFADELAATSGVIVDHEQQGGLNFCLGDEEFNARQQALDSLVAERQPLDDRRYVQADHQMLDRREVEALIPGVALGNEVTGASFCERDGYVNPLKLLTALHEGIRRQGGTIRYGNPVTSLQATSNGYTVTTPSGHHFAKQIVVAAGLSTSQVASMVGLNVPVVAERGQILVTERVEPFLALPASGLRQTKEGTVTIGATQEKVGLDVTATVEAAARLAHRARRVVPALAEVRVVRQWAGLRVLTPDKCPIYAATNDGPKAFAAACHSGVTLAAFHAQRLGPAIAEGRLPTGLETFDPRRFDAAAHN